MRSSCSSSLLKSWSPACLRRSSYTFTRFTIQYSRKQPAGPACGTCDRRRRCHAFFVKGATNPRAAHATGGGVDVMLSLLTFHCICTVNKPACGTYDRRRRGHNFFVSGPLYNMYTVRGRRYASFVTLGVAFVYVTTACKVSPSTIIDTVVH
jgi:hypothetical protein